MFYFSYPIFFPYWYSCHCVPVQVLRSLCHHRLSCHIPSTGSPFTVPAFQHRLSCVVTVPVQAFLSLFQHKLSCHCSIINSLVTVQAQALHSCQCSSTGSPVTVPAESLLSLFQHRLSCDCSSRGSSVTVPAHALLSLF